jgi:hypothetical protein
LLIEEGFTYHMDDYSDDAPFWDVVHARPIVIVPYALDNNDMKFWTAPALTPAQWLEYAIDTFDVLYDEGAAQPRLMSLGVHLRIIGRPGRIRCLRAFSATRTQQTARVDRHAQTDCRPFRGARAGADRSLRMPDAVDRLVQHLLDTQFADLSSAAVTAAKVFCLDTLGVTVAGTSAAYAAEMRTAA